MKYDQIETLVAYLRNVETALLKEDSRSLVIYAKENVSSWNAERIDVANQKLLDSVSGVANVYAIFTALQNSDSFSLRYIGKTTRKLARQRIRNHLIKKDEKTGAKLEHIKALVRSGGSVKISWVKIEPESLRNYVEEELINEHTEADWNKHKGKQ
jgi:hypothetical protein